MEHAEADAAKLRKIIKYAKNLAQKNGEKPGSTYITPLSRMIPDTRKSNFGYSIDPSLVRLSIELKCCFLEEIFLSLGTIIEK